MASASRHHLFLGQTLKFPEWESIAFRHKKGFPDRTPGFEWNAPEINFCRRQIEAGLKLNAGHSFG
jgi:hypothetical protein